MNLGQILSWHNDNLDLKFPYQGFKKQLSDCGKKTVSKKDRKLEINK